MRRIWLALFFAAWPCLTHCSSGSDDGGGSNCGGGQGYAIDVPGPKCSLFYSCNPNQWKLDCSAGNGQCTCFENDVAKKQVAYDNFCPPDFTSKDHDSYYDAARAACGWP